MSNYDANGDISPGNLDLSNGQISYKETKVDE